MDMLYAVYIVEMDSMKQIVMKLAVNFAQW